MKGRERNSAPDRNGAIREGLNSAGRGGGARPEPAFANQARARRRTLRGPEPSAESERLARTVIGSVIEVRRHLGPQAHPPACAEALGTLLGVQRVPFTPIRPDDPEDSEAATAADGKCVTLLVGRGRDAIIAALDFEPDQAEFREAAIRSLLSARELRLGIHLRYNRAFDREEVRRVVGV